MRRNEGRQRTLPTWLCTHSDRATHGPRRRSHGRVSTASGAGGARLRRRAVGGGILAGAAMGGSRAAASDNVMLHSMRGDVMAHDGRWTSGQWGGASNRRVAGSTTGAELRGDWGKMAQQVSPICQ
jgi:hypothetical protein